MRNFYGYKHWTLEPMSRCFYVGKGLSRRSKQKSNRNHKWYAIVKRYGLRVEICVGPITHEEVCVWEKIWIANENTYSTNHSHDDPNDIGCNFTRGGDGVVGWKHTDEWKKQHSARLIGNKHGLVNKGKKKPPRTLEHCQNISKAKKGKKNPWLVAYNKKRKKTQNERP